jgi:hypothetical protein
MPKGIGLYPIDHLKEPLSFEKTKAKIEEALGYAGTTGIPINEGPHNDANIYAYNIDAVMGGCVIRYGESPGPYLSKISVPFGNNKWGRDVSALLFFVGAADATVGKIENALANSDIPHFKFPQE